MNNPNKIITHHALSSRHHTVNDVNEWHKVRWPRFISRRGYHVGYHYVIGWDGTVTQTRDHDEEGAHCIGQNRSSIGVCFMGNFDLHYPSKEQEAAWCDLYERIGNGMPVFPHRLYATKSCHGKLLSDDYFAVMVIANRKRQLLERINQLQSLLRSMLLQRRV
jgi:N-acetylmuramoyl-L-alanine amidase